MSTAWILGAGFSKALGGPLLREFFTQDLDYGLGLWGKTLLDPGRHPSLPPFETMPDVLRSVFRFGVHDDDSSPEGISRLAKRPWRTSEEFFELVDLAFCAGPAELSRALRASSDQALNFCLGGLGSPQGSLEEIRLRHANLPKLIRWYMAMACEFFLPSLAEVDYLERWRPYRRWAERCARQGDWVLSFNYDRVVELSARALEGEQGQILSRALLPHDAALAGAIAAGFSNWGDFEASGASSRLLKLHGSTTWGYASEGPCGEAYSAREIQEACDLHEMAKSGWVPALAAPGITKGLETRDQGSFESLWRGAEEVLRRASVVVFMGYRFPESDAQARERLLGALRDNREANLTLRIVLGPKGVCSDDIARLEAMLRWALAGREITLACDEGAAFERAPRDGRRRAAIVVEPMWPHDFFAVFEPEALDAWEKRGL